MKKIVNKISIFTSVVLNVAYWLVSVRNGTRDIY